MKQVKLLLIFLSLSLAQVLGQTDTLAPSITLASTSTELTSPGTIFLAAVASDASGITKVEFYRGGSLLFSDVEAPYSVGVSLGEADSGNVSFDAIAYDTSGNSTRSNLVTVAVTIGGATTPANPTTPTTPNTTTTPQTSGALQANNDSYTALVNTLLIAGNISSGGMAALSSGQTLLANDTGVDSSSQVQAETISTQLGGEVSLYADGGFSYQPPLNTFGTDSFSYTVSSGAASSTAVVTVQISPANQAGHVYYVSASSTGGDGHAARPFARLSDAEEVSQTGDIIVLQTGTYASLADHQISLKDGQQLLGQGKEVVINGQTVLAASNPPLLLRSGGASLVLANNVIVKGLTVTRANVSGTATDDTGTGSGASGIVIPAGLSGSVAIEDVTIRYVGGFGILVQSDGNKANRLSSLTLTNVTIESPGYFAIAVDDVIDFVMTGGQINNLRNNPDEGGSGRGIAVEAEYDSKVSISGVTVNSIGDNTKAIYISKNTSSGETSTMNVTLSNNSLLFPETGADASVAVTVGYTDTASGSILLDGQGNTTNSISPFYLSSSGNGVMVGGKVLINNFEYPRD
ncbi:MAG: cadherin-like domain-containing protein [Trueperaceae bacterium]|nr:cadherin-like domain-containing protein [Trueperaceae bacterium]